MRKNKLPATSAAIIALLIVLNASGAEHSSADALEQTLVNRNTTLNLIDALVKRGILDQASADAMIADARANAVRDARQELASRPTGAAPAERSTNDGITVQEDAVHVYYIPKAVKEELAQDVQAGVREQVVAQVKADAKRERWGVPAALPAWVDRFSLSADMRLRAEANLFASDNQAFSYLDWPSINKRGGLLAAGPEAFRNTTVDRLRFRARTRLSIDARVTDDFKFGLRLATSNERDPVSINQTLGQTGQQYEVAIDRLFVQYDMVDSTRYDWLTVWAGRHTNPWLSTETLFDRDLSFEGAAATFRLPLGGARRGGNLQAGGPLANWGYSEPRSLFLTLGGFPLQEVEFSTRDKWMLGGQTGIDWGFRDDSRFKLALAYYDFKHIDGQPNTLGSRELDFTAPQFFTKGNSLIRISNDIGETLANPRLVGLASDFNLLDITGVYDYAGFGPLHLIATGSYTKNVGFDRQHILRVSGQDIAPQTEAWELRLDIGQPRILHRHDWNLGFAYRRNERDAVLDAYTNSLFHLGGTDARGWILGGSYGLARNTWVHARWISTEAIDGPPFGVDALLLDFNTAL